MAAGDALLSPSATTSLIGRFRAQPQDGEPDLVSPRLDVLTDRERAIVALVVKGLNNDNIATKLSLSPLTATTHVNRAMTKLGARDRAELVVISDQAGLVRAGDPDAIRGHHGGSDNRRTEPGAQDVACVLRPDARRCSGTSPGAPTGSASTPAAANASLTAALARSMSPMPR